jgi:hypothetical protein
MKYRTFKRKVKKIKPFAIIDWILTSIVTIICGVIELVALCSGEWITAAAIVALGVCLLLCIKWVIPND